MLKKKLATLLQTASHPLAGQSALVAVSNYLAAALGFLTAVVGARLLAPADYGLATLAIAYPSLIWSLCAVKTETVTIRYLSRFRLAGDSHMLLSMCKFGYGIDLLSSVIASCIVGVTAWWVADAFYSHSELAWLMVAYGLALPLRALASTSIAVFSSWERFHWTAISHLFDRLTTFLCVVGFLLAGFGVSGMVLGAALVQAAMGVLLAIGAHAFLVRAGVGSWWTASLQRIMEFKQEIRGFLGWSYLTSTLGGLAEQIPLLLLGRLRGPEEAGFFRLASNLVTVAAYVEGALGRVTYPRLSARWASNSKDSFRTVLLRWTTWAGIPIALCLLAVVPLLPTLVSIMFGNRYIPMITGTQVMVGCASIGTLFFWLSSSYYAMGRVRFWAQGYAVYTAVLLTLAWWATSSWGFLGISMLSGVMKATFSIVMAWFILTPESLNRETMSAARAGRG
jgi:O-antigen/teichoic acid export membrane protein